VPDLRFFRSARSGCRYDRTSEPNCTYGDARSDEQWVTLRKRDDRKRDCDSVARLACVVIDVSGI